jgi:DNA-binding PadR family transcriptional regulator
MAASRKRKSPLTELEGAILSAVRRGTGLTAYRLRQAFLASPSMEWSGSAGAVYPAMRRLTAAGFLDAKPSDDRRGTEHYRLTAAGGRALLSWASDVTRTVSAGMDPFRSRAPEWLVLRSRQRAPLLREIEKALNARCAALELKIAAAGPIEREQASLELELQRVRLRWLAARKRL